MIESGDIVGYFNKLINETSVNQIIVVIFIIMVGAIAGKFSYFDVCIPGSVFPRKSPMKLIFIFLTETILRSK